MMSLRDIKDENHILSGRLSRLSVFFLDGSTPEQQSRRKRFVTTQRRLPTPYQPRSTEIPLILSFRPFQ